MTSTFKQIWQTLKTHQSTLENISIKQLFLENNQRFDAFSFEFNNILFDFSKQRINDTTLKLLCQLAEACQLIERRDDLFSGKKLNPTENRAVLHTLLRASSLQDFWWEGKNLTPLIQNELEKMRQFSEALRHAKKKGMTGKPFTDVLCLGIGGSELGPAFISEALSRYVAKSHRHDSAEASHPPSAQSNLLKPHFLSNIDGHTLTKTLSQLNPETTLCLISSKTFTTPETLTNAKALKNWYRKHLGASHETQHFLATTANPKAAEAFGILPQHIFEFWDWIGGRYSIWSAVGLPIILSAGYDHFKEFLEGAQEMDHHFKETPFTQNIPVISALIGIWNNNFLGFNTQAILPYEDSLRLLPNYLQQLEMESNGKSINRDNQICPYHTASILFGGIGCNAQHAYMQLLHQSNHIVPVDFLIPAKPSSHYTDHHKLLLASALSQSKALMEGQEAEHLYQSCSGNRPSTTIMYDTLTPKILGSLLAMYEHKVFVQGIIWGINSFDQWGVELGKTLAKIILPTLDTKYDRTSAPELESLDSSTLGLIRFFQKKNQEIE